MSKRPPPCLADTAKASLDAFLHESVISRKYPAITLGAIGAQGDPVYFACEGDKVFGEPDKGQVDDGTWFQLYSMSKLVTAVAVLQLVDLGKVDLDSPDLLARYCPELAALDVLTGFTDKGGEPTFVPRTIPLTTRHLLTHTSGLSYTFNSGRMARYNELKGGLFDWPRTMEGYCSPLIFQPGEKWHYSTGVDWAGFLVERVSGMRLSEYFSTHIFGPLGIDDALSFFPTPDVIAKLQVCCKWDGDRLVHSGSPRLDEDRVRAAPLRAGGGLYGSAMGYLRFMQGVLAAEAGVGLISPASFRTLFTDSLAPPVAAQMGRDVAAMLGSEAGEDAEKVGQSVGSLVFKADSRFGPKAGTGAWGGTANTQWWLDPTTGVAGICFTQLMGPSPESFNDVYTAYQRRLYDALEDAG